MDLLARIEVDGVCLGGIRLSGVLRPKQVASVGAQTKTRAWAFRLGSSCASGVSHARCKWLPATCSPYHTSIRARLATPVRSLLPVTSNILPTKTRRVAQDCDPKTYMYMSSGRKDALIGRFSWASTVARNKAAHWKANQHRTAKCSQHEARSEPQIGRMGFIRHAIFGIIYPICERKDFYER